MISGVKEEMSVDIAEQMIFGSKWFREWKFGLSIQLDESADVTNNAQLLVCVRYTQDNSVKTNLLMVKELSGSNERKGCFRSFGQFFQTEWTGLGKVDWLCNRRGSVYART